MAAEAICTLYKPVANMMMDGVEGSNRVIDDELCEAFDVQQTRSQNNQLSLFCRRLAYKLAQITDGAARAIVRNEDTENGFEIWRRLHKQFSLPQRVRATNLLNEIIGFRLRNDHLESDLSEFMILNDRHEKTTRRPLDYDLLITMLMQKAVGPLQQHLRLNVRRINTFKFNEALEIVHRYIKRRHLTWSIERKERTMEGKGHKGGKGMYKRKGKATKANECTRAKLKEEAKMQRQRKRTRNERKRPRRGMLLGVRGVTGTSLGSNRNQSRRQ